MKFNYIYYILSIILYIWSQNFPNYYYFVDENSESFSSEESFDSADSQQKVKSQYLYFIFIRFVYILVSLLGETIITIMLNFIKGVYNHNISSEIVTSIFDDVRISMHRDYALDGIFGLFFNRYFIKNLCSFIGMFLFLTGNNKHDFALLVFSIFYDMSRAVRWRILPNYEYEEIVGRRSPYMFAEINQSIKLDMTELNEETREQRVKEVNKMMRNLDVKINEARERYNQLQHELFADDLLPENGNDNGEDNNHPQGGNQDNNNQDASSELGSIVEISDSSSVIEVSDSDSIIDVTEDDQMQDRNPGDDDDQPNNIQAQLNDVLNRRNQPQEPQFRMTDEQRNLKKDEMNRWKKEFDKLVKEQRAVCSKWFEQNVYGNNGYVKVKLDKMDDLEKYAGKYDHFIYTRDKGRISFTTKLWRKFEDGLYEYTRDRTYVLVDVTTDTKFLNLLCVHALSKLQQLMLTPPKIYCNSWFGITRQEKMLLTRCYYARRLYSILAAYLQGKVPNIEILDDLEFEGLVAFACSHAFGNRGLGRFEQWMSLSSNEYFEDMGFTVEN